MKLESAMSNLRSWLRTCSRV